MNTRRFLWIVLLASLPFSAIGAADKRAPEVQNKVALVIGNSRYTNALPLKNPENDAKDMCAAFRKVGFEVICKLDIATKRDFKDAIYEFTGKVNRNSVAAFYFAGHGIQMDGVNYLIPTTAALRTKSDLEDESVQINYLMSELESRAAALNVFIIDACRDNPFASPIRGYVPALGLASQIYTPRNSIVALSTGPGQLSLDGSGRNGTYTKNLVQHLATPDQSIEDMFKAVGKGTRADAGRFGRQQDPQTIASFTERFCMGGCGEAATPRGREPARPEADRLQAIRQNELEAERQALLKKQDDVDRLRQSLAAQQARMEAEQNTRTRAIAPPEKPPEKPAKPVNSPPPAF